MVEDKIIEDTKYAYNYLLHQIGGRISELLGIEEYLTEEWCVLFSQNLASEAIKINMGEDLDYSEQEKEQIVSNAIEVTSLIKSSKEYREMVEVIDHLREYRAFNDNQRIDEIIDEYDRTFRYLDDIEEKLEPFNSYQVYESVRPKV